MFPFPFIYEWAHMTIKSTLRHQIFGKFLCIFLQWMWQNVRIEEWHSIVLLGGKCLKASLEKYFCAISLPVLLLFAHPSEKMNFPPIMWPFFFTAHPCHRDVELWPLSKLRFESPSSTSRELSSPIFQSLPVRDRCHLTRSLFVSIQALLVISTIKKEPVLFYTALHGSCRPV